MGTKSQTTSGGAQGGGQRSGRKPAVKRTPVERLDLQWGKFYSAAVKYASVQAQKGAANRKSFSELVVAMDALEQHLLKFIRDEMGLEAAVESSEGVSSEVGAAQDQPSPEGDQSQGQ